MLRKSSAMGPQRRPPLCPGQSAPSAFDDGAAGPGRVRTQPCADPLVDERVVHIGHHRHQRADTGIWSPANPAGSHCHPTFPGGCRRFPWKHSKRHPHSQAALCILQSPCAPGWCGSVTSNSSTVNLPGFKGCCRNADLSNVVQGRGLVEQLDHPLVEHGPNLGWLRKRSANAFTHTAGCGECGCQSRCLAFLPVRSWP